MSDGNPINPGLAEDLDYNRLASLTNVNFGGGEKGTERVRAASAKKAAEAAAAEKAAAAAKKPGLLTRLWNGIKGIGSAIVGLFKSKPQADVKPKVAAAAAKPEEPAQVKFESTFDLDTLSKVTKPSVPGTMRQNLGKMKNVRGP